MSNDTKLTSVKILEGLYNRFKIDCVKSDTTLQKLTNRAIHLYLHDDEFKSKINENDALTISGSNF